MYIFRHLKLEIALKKTIQQHKSQSTCISSPHNKVVCQSQDKVLNVLIYGSMPNICVSSYIAERKYTQY